MHFVLAQIEHPARLLPAQLPALAELLQRPRTFLVRADVAGVVALDLHVPVPAARDLGFVR